LSFKHYEYILTLSARVIYSLKGTGSPNGLRYFLYACIAIGLIKCRGWLLNF
jgi:hypothetical protein